jgi:hypothetical protein
VAALAVVGWRVRPDPSGRAGASPGTTLSASGASWEPGSQRVYDIDYAASGGYAMAGDAAGSGAFALTLHGALTATVLDERDGRRDVELRLHLDRIDTTRMQVRTPPDRLANAIEQPISVAYDARGVIAGVILPPELPPEASRLLRELASHLQVAVGAGPAWTAVAPEPAGECLISYRRDGDRIEARKQRFVRVVRGGELVAVDTTDGVPTFTRSSASYRVDRAGRVVDASIEEDQTSAVAAVGATAHAEVRVRVTQASAMLDLSRARAVASAGLRPLTTVAGDDADAAPQVTRVPPAQLRARIEQAAASGDVAAMHQAQLQLSQALASDPSGLPAVTNGQPGQALLAAIGAAGTAAAQAALLEIGRDAARPLETRREAIDAFHQVADASDDTMSALASLADDEPALRENALLAMGALANRMRRLDGDGASAWAERLVEQYQQAHSDAERIVALDALGNSGDGAGLDVLEGALASGSIELQVSAAQNLRLMPAPRADQLLTAALVPGVDGRVRRAAMFAIGFRRYDAVHGALDAIARRDPDVELRTSGLNALITYLQRDRAIDALPLIRWIASHDGDASIRDAANRALTQG